MTRASEQYSVAKPVAGGRRPKRKERKNIAYGVAHIKSSFNNTIITFTDQQGNCSRGRRPATSASRARARARRSRRSSRPRRRRSWRMEHGVRKVDVLVKGPGSGRETAIRSIQNAGIEVVGIKDVTPIPHNGCRPAQACGGV